MGANEPGTYFLVPEVRILPRDAVEKKEAEEMSNWSEESDKVLCLCGTVFLTKTKLEGDKYLLKDPCLNCGRSDGVDEICSTEKMSHRKARKIVEAFCDIMEMNPFEIMGGRLTYDAGNLAQHIEDVGRVKAAARIRKGVEALKGGFLKQAAGMMKGPTEEAKKFILKAQPFSDPMVQMLPSCEKCKAAVMDWTPEWRWTVGGYFCSPCRSSLSNSQKAAIVSALVEKTIRLAREMAAGAEKVVEEIKTLEPYDPPDPV